MRLYLQLQLVSRCCYRQKISYYFPTKLIAKRLCQDLFDLGSHLPIFKFGTRL